MYLDKDIFSRLANDKGHNKLLILEFLSDSRRPKTLSEIVDHLLTHSERRASVARDGRVVLKQLHEMEDQDLITSNRDARTWTWEVVGRLRELDNMPVGTKNMPHLLNWEKMFEKYQFLPFFNDIQAFIDQQKKRIEEQKDGDNGLTAHRIADFETGTTFKGQETIGVFYLAIEDCETISFEYRSFGKTSAKKYNHIEPYLLKEHNNRWYLIARVAKESGFRVFPLDRIEKVLESEQESSFVRGEFNPDTLWEHSMGIDLGWIDRSTGEYRIDPVEISFEVKDGSELKNIAYLETSPIHPSQKLKKLKDGYVKVSMKTFPVADAVRAVRALGVHNLRNVKPDYFSNWVLNE